MKEYFEDDRPHWRDACKGMTIDEIEREIERIEKEEAEKKAKFLAQKKNPA